MLEACRTGGESAERGLYQHLQEAVPLIPVCFKNDSLLTHSGTVENAQPTAADIFYNFPDWRIYLSQTEQEKGAA